MCMYIFTMILYKREIISADIISKSCCCATACCREFQVSELLWWPLCNVIPILVRYGIITYVSASCIVSRRPFHALLEIWELYSSTPKLNCFISNSHERFLFFADSSNISSDFSTSSTCRSRAIHADSHVCVFQPCKFVDLQQVHRECFLEIWIESRFGGGGSMDSIDLSNDWTNFLLLLSWTKI